MASLIRAEGPRRNLTAKENFTLTLNVTRGDTWRSVDHPSIQGLVQWWIRYPEDNRGIEIECTDCTSSEDLHYKKSGKFEDLGHQYRPYLLVDVPDKQSALNRKKRSDSGECSGLSCCQMRELYIEFAAINWNFIRSPKGIHANYCFGECRGRPTFNFKITSNAIFA